MPADNTAHLTAATARRATGSRQRARAALKQLDREGTVINYVTVAEAARVSRALLYRDPDLRKEIDRLRERTQPSVAPHQPSAQRMSQASRDEIIATLREEARTLRAENQTLRGRLGALPRRTTRRGPRHPNAPSTTCPRREPPAQEPTTRRPLQITINGLIELHRRIARGFTNRENYRPRMLLIASGLTHPNL